MFSSFGFFLKDLSEICPWLSLATKTVTKAVFEHLFSAFSHIRKHHWDSFTLIIFHLVILESHSTSLMCLAIILYNNRI